MIIFCLNIVYSHLLDFIVNIYIGIVLVVAGQGNLSFSFLSLASQTVACSLKKRVNGEKYICWEGGAGAVPWVTVGYVYSIGFFLVIVLRVGFLHYI